MREVVVTLWPDTVLEVEESEYIDLKRDGLVIRASEPIERPEDVAPTGDASDEGSEK